jgi:tRNA (cytosine38-C5)-methyltransferase
MLARRGGSHFPLENKVWRNIPDCKEDAQVVAIREYLDTDVDEASGVPEKVLKKWGRLFDIVKPSSARSCCFTRGYRHLVERSGSILQEAEELDVRVLPVLFCFASHILF